MANRLGTAPRLRPLELKWMEEGDQRVLFLRDPGGVAPSPAFVPAWVAVLLSFCDGERDVSAVRAAFELHTGQPITTGQVQRVLDELDEALFLDSPRYAEARERLGRTYREAAFRAPALAGRVYPDQPSELVRALDGYGCDAAPEALAATGEVRGVVSPHIDYQRGGPVYARTWRGAASAVQSAEVVFIFGTDHAGGPGKLTLTRQSYATPLGVLPTAVPVVDSLAEAIGEEAAFEEEIHHRNEHSVELAAVWLHHTRIGPPPEVVPILCGSFHRFTEGEEDPEADETFARVMDALRESTRGKRVLAVAAADLAHVGPAFGDPRPYRPADREALKRSDAQLLNAIQAGSASQFFGLLREERDCRRICGLPPIYLLLRFLGDCRGELVAYDQCPADHDGGSFVSIAGALLR
jgi:AmmeMemoRadiSam system protein B